MRDLYKHGDSQDGLQIHSHIDYTNGSASSVWESTKLLV
jgi:hypothetical protein